MNMKHKDRVAVVQFVLEQCLPQPPWSRLTVVIGLQVVILALLLVDIAVGIHVDN